MSVVSDILSGIAGGAAAATPTGAVSAVANVASKVIDWIHPNPNDPVAVQARVRLAELENSGALAELAADTDLLKGQLEINKIDAANKKFTWRDAGGWICSIGLGVAYLLFPLAQWVVALVSPETHLPTPDTAELIAIFLGLAGIRSFDKVKGVARGQ